MNFEKISPKSKKSEEVPKGDKESKQKIEDLKSAADKLDKEYSQLQEELDNADDPEKKEEIKKELNKIGEEFDEKSEKLDDLQSKEEPEEEFREEPEGEAEEEIDKESEEESEEELEEEPEDEPEEGSEEEAESTEKSLKTLKKAREKLVDAEIAKKQYEGITGKLKGFVNREDKANVIKEYKEALEAYQELKCEHMEDILDEKSEITKLRIEKLSEKKGWLSNIKKFYNKLGEQNLAKLLGKGFREKIKAKASDSVFKKVLKFGARFASKTISLRLAVSIGLVGGAAAFGGGLAAAGLLGIKKAMLGLGTGLGSYELFSRFGDEKTLSNVRKEVDKGNLDKMSAVKIAEKMAYFEQQAEETGDEKILGDEVYIKLRTKFAEKYSEVKKANEKGKEVHNNIKSLIKETDQKLAEQRKEHDKKDIKRKVISGVIGGVVGSGLVGKLIKWVKGGDDAAQEVTTEIDKGEVTTEIDKKGVTNAARENINEDLRGDFGGDPKEMFVTKKFPPLEDKFLGGEVEFQGGNSVWEETENQFSTRWDGFSDLSEAEKTYLVDYVKDRVVESPGDFGLKGVEDLNNLTSDQLKAIEWNELFKTDKSFTDWVDSVDTLTEAQRENILSNNALNAMEEDLSDLPPGLNVDMGGLQNTVDTVDITEYIIDDPYVDNYGAFDLQERIGDEIGNVNEFIDQNGINDLLGSEQGKNQIMELAQAGGLNENQSEIFAQWLDNEGVEKLGSETLNKKTLVANIVGNTGETLPDSSVNLLDTGNALDVFHAQWSGAAEDLNSQILDFKVFGSLKGPIHEWGEKLLDLAPKESRNFFDYLTGQKFNGAHELFKNMKNWSTYYDKGYILGKKMSSLYTEYLQSK